MISVTEMNEKKNAIFSTNKVRSNTYVSGNKWRVLSFGMETRKFATGITAILYTSR
jgi:hypothetical protein